MKGLRITVNFSMRVGSGTGPVTVDPVRCAVSTICAADLSISLWSYALSRIRMRCFDGIYLFQDLRDDTRAHGVPTLADGEADSRLEGDRRPQGDFGGDVVAGHDQLGAFRQLDVAGDVGGAQVELRAVPREEGGMTATLLL